MGVKHKTGSAENRLGVLCCAVYWIYLLRIVTNGKVCVMCAWLCVCVDFVICVYVCVCTYVYMHGFCNMCVCVGGGLMCGCFDNCVGVLVICVLALTVFCIVSFICIYSYLLLM